MKLIEKIAVSEKSLSKGIRAAHTGAGGAYGGAGGGYLGHVLSRGAKSKAGRIASIAAGALGGGALGAGAAKVGRRVGRALYEKPGK